MEKWSGMSGRLPTVAPGAACTAGGSRTHGGSGSRDDTQPQTAAAHLVQLLAAGMHAAEHVHGAAACKSWGKT